MAYRITGTTDPDRALLTLIRDQAWHMRVDVSQVIREAFLLKLFGTRSHWPDEYKDSGQ